MLTAPKLKQLIEDIAKKHGFDLYQFSAYLCLVLDSERLIVENLGSRRISIVYQLFRFDDWLTDLEVVIWIKNDPSEEDEFAGQWVPTEIYQIEDGRKACAGVASDGTMAAIFRPQWQLWLGSFVETVVVPNLIGQGWLEKGIKSDEQPPSYTPKQMWERGYLIVEDDQLDGLEVDHDIPF